MKLILINHFPLQGSGSGTYTGSIAQHLALRGHEVHVLFPENTPTEPLPGVELHPVPFTGGPVPLPGALPFNFPCFTTHPRSTTTFGELREEELQAYLTAFRTRLQELCQRVQPDLLHAQHVWCLADVAAETGLPLVVTTHGTDLMGYQKWPHLRPYAQRAVEHCHRLLAVSGDNLSAARMTFPQVADKLTLLQNGYNELTFYPQPLDRRVLFAQLGLEDQGQAVVLFAGKLTAFKGVDTLLHAARDYETAAGDSIVTLIAGSGQDGPALKQLARELGLRQVYFLGHKSPQELRRLYSTADVLAMPSRREPFGLVALEAMACGCPVVVTNEGGLPEFVTPESGSLVPVDAPAQLSQALLRELDRSRQAPARRESIARHARSNHSQGEFITRLEGIYAQVCSR